MPDSKPTYDELKAQRDHYKEQRDTLIRIFNNPVNRVRQAAYEFLDEIRHMNPDWCDERKRRLDQAAAPTDGEKQVINPILDEQVADKIASGKGMEPAK